MRITVELDDDVAALIENDRARTGESISRVINRLLRHAARTGPALRSEPVPLLPGGPMLDVGDVSALLGTLDDARRAERGVL